MNLTPNDPVREKLARALGVTRGRIVRYGQDGSEYTVLLDDFRKVRVGVDGASGGAEVRDAEEEQAGGSGGGGAAEDVAPRLASVLERPHLYDRAVLRRVGERLGIPGAAELNKKPLVRAINGWKRARAQEQRGR